MKVLVIAGGIPSDEEPLSGIFEFDQANALHNSGIDIDYFCIDLRSIRRLRKFGISHFSRNGVRCHVLSIPLGNIPLNLFCDIGSVALQFLFEKVFKGADCPDIIHAHFVEYGNMAARLSKKTGIPLVITEHSSDMIRTPIPHNYKKIAIGGYSVAKRLIAVSKQLSTNLKSQLGVNSIVIHNMIDMNIFSKRILTPHKSFVFTIVAGLIKRKRVDLVVSVIEKMLHNGCEVILNVIGDGEEKELLKTYIKTNKLDRNIILHGRLTRTETVSVYNTTDCFVLASERETFGVVYVEAMAAGIPVIATACGGPEDFVTSENGLLVEVGNENMLYESMLYMYNNIDKYDAETIKNSVRIKFSEASIAHKLIDNYNNIIKEMS